MKNRSSILQAFGLFKRAQNGSVAIIFAISILPIMGIIGAAVDYGAVLASKTELDSIADAAALAGADQATLSETSTTAQARAISAFNAQVGNVKNNVSVSALSATVTDTTTTRTVKINYTASRPTSFVGILGVSTMSFSGTTTAQTGRATYMDFHLLLDNTPSMAVGATLSDIAKLEAKYGCAFACHIEGSTTDSYAWAQKNGVKLRIDMVRQATQSLMDTATTSQTVTSQYRMAIHTFGSSCKILGLTTLINLTSNLTAAKSAAGLIDTMTIPYQGYNEDQCTDYVNTLRTANDAISAPGSGATSATPQKVLFFVADGVNDSVASNFGCSKPLAGATRCQEPINTTWCTTIKNRGIKIAVLYTTYLPLPSNGWYNAMIAPFQAEIPQKMAECASPGLYFEVTPTQGITEAMKALFQQTIARAKLIN